MTDACVIGAKFKNLHLSFKNPIMSMTSSNPPLHSAMSLGTSGSGSLSTAATEYETEICVTSLEGCKIAERLGATRVELCSALSEGGLTPTLGMVRAARKVLHNTKLFVLIRVRAGDFVYSDDEIDIMCEDIKLLVKEGVDGVVIGALTKEAQVDTKANLKLMNAAQSLNITFHRAFDKLGNQAEALAEIKQLQSATGNRISRILTSGGKASAYAGMSRLNELQALAGEIRIMAGAGINSKNIAELKQGTNIKAFHFSAKTTIPSTMINQNPDVYMGLPNSDEDMLTITSESEAAAIIAIVKGR